MFQSVETIQCQVYSIMSALKDPQQQFVFVFFLLRSHTASTKPMSDTPFPDLPPSD